MSIQIQILCTPTFSADEMKQVDDVAKKLGLTREEFIRLAVTSFSAECVPTHSGDAVKDAQK